MGDNDGIRVFATDDRIDRINKLVQSLLRRAEGTLARQPVPSTGTAATSPDYGVNTPWLRSPMVWESASRTKEPPRTIYRIRETKIVDLLPVSRFVGPQAYWLDLKQANHAAVEYGAERFGTSANDKALRKVLGLSALHKDGHEGGKIPFRCKFNLVTIEVISERQAAGWHTLK